MCRAARRRSRPCLRSTAVTFGQVAPHLRAVEGGEAPQQLEGEGHVTSRERLAVRPGDTRAKREPESLVVRAPVVGGGQPGHVARGRAVEYDQRLVDPGRRGPACVRLVEQRIEHALPDAVARSHGQGQRAGGSGGRLGKDAGRHRDGCKTQRQRGHEDGGQPGERTGGSDHPVEVSTRDTTPAVDRARSASAQEASSASSVAALGGLATCAAKPASSVRLRSSGRA